LSTAAAHFDFIYFSTPGSIVISQRQQWPNTPHQPTLFTQKISNIPHNHKQIHIQPCTHITACELLKLVHLFMPAFCPFAIK